jgi:hypothetical protein
MRTASSTARLVHYDTVLVVLGCGVEPTIALVASQVALCLGILFALVPLLHLTASSEVMGRHVTRTPVASLAGIVTRRLSRSGWQGPGKPWPERAQPGSSLCQCSGARLTPFGVAYRRVEWAPLAEEFRREDLRGGFSACAARRWSFSSCRSMTIAMPARFSPASSRWPMRRSRSRSWAL